MSKRRPMTKRIGLLSLFAVAALAGAFACTTTTTTTETPSGDAGKDAKTTTGTKDGGDTTEDDAGGLPIDPDQACGDEATLQGCAQCCATNHPAGYKTFEESLLGCACEGTGADGGTGPCATACGATACATPPANPDAACNKCLQDSIGQGGACQLAVSEACTADQECLAQQQCASLCQGKQ